MGDWRSYLREVLWDASSASATVPGEREIRYTVAGYPVCKQFYRSATGIRRQLFHAVVAEITGGKNNPKSADDDDNDGAVQLRIPITQKEAAVCGFFDSYFHGLRV